MEPVTFRRDILIYNRVAKSGSTMLRDLFGFLNLKNDFTFINEKIGLHKNRSRFMETVKQNGFRKRVLEKYQTPLLLVRHINFIQFHDDHHPLYVNMMREPFQRFRSKFIYGRTYQVEPRFHFKYSLREYEPLAVANQSFAKWQNKTLEKCILNDEDRECNMRQGDKVENQLAFFCGQDFECSLHGSMKALRMAKVNVEKYYPTVGILDRLEESLMVMEALLPEFLTGLMRAHKGTKVFNKSDSMKEITKEAFMKMKNNLKVEYEFYEFLNRRLSQQIQKLFNK